MAHSSIDGVFLPGTNYVAHGFKLFCGKSEEQVEHASDFFQSAIRPIGSADY
jgi:hypothetical protein